MTTIVMVIWLTLIAFNGLAFAGRALAKPGRSEDMFFGTALTIAACTVLFLILST